MAYPPRLVLPDSLTALAVLIAAGALAQWLGWRLRVPQILPLLAVGFLLGPLTGTVDVDRVFGSLLEPFVSLAVAIILFEGGITLRRQDLAGAGAVVRNLVTVGAAVTWAGITAAVHWIAEVPFDLALLVAGILVLTGPTVVIPLVRHIRPSGAVGPVLRWEGILIDPIGALLALLVFDAITAPEGQQAADVVLGALLTLGVGSLVGVGGAWLLGNAIRSHWIAERLHVPVAMAVVAAVFAGSNLLQHESGLAGVTVLGIVLANMRGVDLQRIVEFKEDLGSVLLALLFVVLSARLPMAMVTSLGFEHLAVVALGILVVRPVAVACSTLGTRLHWKQRAFLAAMAPRGIVAAAVSSEFALQLEQAGRADAAVVTSMVFAFIVGTVSFYGLLAPRIAQWLGIADANPRGILLVGADALARQLGVVLQQQGVPVLLVDTNPVNVAAARLDGLRAWHGSILADRFFEEVDLAGIGRICAMTGSDEVNLLSVRRFRGVFDGQHLHQLPLRTRSGGRFGLSEQGHGRWLFRPDATAEHLRDLLAGGAVVEATRLTKELGPEVYKATFGDRALVLVVVGEDGRPEVATADAPAVLRPGCVVVGLVSPAAPDVAQPTRG
ncbi:MAG: hypothetical protein RL148_1389 [Planctomycetota bacterium]